jgi:hypothetical protein
MSWTESRHVATCRQQRSVVEGQRTGYSWGMRHLMVVAVVLAFAAGDAHSKKRRRGGKAPAYQAGQTCVLKKPIKVFTKSKKKLTLRKGVKLTLLKVGKQWISVRSDTSIEGSVKLAKSLAKACKPVASAETAKAPPPPDPEPPKVAEVEPVPGPPPEVSASEGADMEMPDKPDPEKRDGVGIQMPAPKQPEKVKAFSALDVLGTDGARSFAVERRSRRQTTRDLLGWGAVGIGGAGVITCAVLIGVSSGKASELAEDIEIYNERPVRTSENAQELEDRKASVAALDAGAIAAGAVGLAAVGAGLFLLLGGGGESYASTWVAPDQGVGVVVGGRF